MIHKGKREAVAYPWLIPGPSAGGDWTVLECNAADSGTSPPERVLMAPKTVVREDLLATMHELEHVKRNALHGHEFGSGQRAHFRKMLEEVAVEADSLAAGVDIRNARDHLAWDGWQVPTDRAAIALMWLQLAYSSPVAAATVKQVWADCDAELTILDQRILRLALEDVAQDTSHAVCEQWADRLSAHFAAPPPQLPKQETAQAQAARAAASAAEQEQAMEAARSATRKGKAEQEAARTKVGTHTHGTEVYGTKLDVHRHAALRSARAIGAQGWRAVESSTVLRFPQRFIYGYPFGVKAKGGSVLIDASSSMGWNPDLLAAAIGHDLPGLWAAYYAGKMKFAGRLCIIAERGKVGKYIPKCGGMTEGNENQPCNAASLEYMVRAARGPYVWVSDGIVGHGSELGAWRQPVDALLRKHRIVRVRRLEDALAFLNGYAVPCWRQCDNNPQVLLKRGQA